MATPHRLGGNEFAITYAYSDTAEPTKAAHTWIVDQPVTKIPFPRFPKRRRPQNVVELDRARSVRRRGSKDIDVADATHRVLPHSLDFSTAGATNGSESESEVDSLISIPRHDAETAPRSTINTRASLRNKSIASTPRQDNAVAGPGPRTLLRASQRTRFTPPSLSPFHTRRTEVATRSNVTTAWFESVGPEPLVSPPIPRDTDGAKPGDIFLHRDIDNPHCYQAWVWESRGSGLSWRRINSGEKRDTGDSNSRLLHVAAHRLSWVDAKYYRYKCAKLVKPNRWMHTAGNLKEPVIIGRYHRPVLTSD
ncbi:hypothetical protein PLICRDRAFT_173290 [Plicaturopsis crispa FD-325 SS-3]|nr:hypothetical protein PLICRDRAFT_173290 [Plicaturopsis crispa FD-325 SS-3]